MIKELENLHKIPDSAFVDETVDTVSHYHPEEEEDISDDNLQTEEIDPEFDGHVQTGEFITGAVVLDIANALVPMLFVVAFDKGMNATVDKRSFVLTASEKRTLEPIVQACLKKLNMNFDDPFTALAVVGGFIYGSKAVHVYTTLEPTPDNKGKSIVDKKPTSKGYTKNGVKIGRPKKNA